MEDLTKIDVIRKRFGVSYREALSALERANGSVALALADLEERDRAKKERIQVKGSELVDRVREIIHQGNVTRIRIRQGDRAILEIPVTVGVVGALLLPTLAVVGVIAAVVTQCTIEVERAPGGERAAEKAGNAPETGERPAGPADEDPAE